MFGVINQPLRLLYIFVLFYGIVARQVQLNGNITENIGRNGTKLTCNFTKDQGDGILSVWILATNITLHDFENVALFDPDFGSSLRSFGTVLFGNASLSRVDSLSKTVSMSFDDLNCKHSRLYKCQLVVKTMDIPSITTESEAMGISVQVSPSKPDSILLVHTPVDSPVPTTKHMDYSSSSHSTAVTSNKNETVFASETEKQTTTTAFNRFTIQTPDPNTTTSTLSHEDISTNSSYTTTIYYIQHTTTALGIAEGDNITVVCTGDVGNPPVEHFFQKYLNGKIVPMHEKVSATSISEMNENCSNYRTSNLTFQATAKDNNAVIRCAVDSSKAEPDMYVETAPIEVYSGQSTPSTSGSGDNRAKDNGTAIVIVVVLIVIGVVVLLIFLLYRTIKIEDNKYEHTMESNINLIKSQNTTREIPPTSSTKKTTGYEDVDFDDTDMKFKPVSNEETIDEVNQHNDEYLKKQEADEDKAKDNPTTPPQAAVYACVNKPKNTVTIENNTTAGQQEEDLYEESKEGIYDTSGDRRHKESITENLKNEESDGNEQKRQVGAYINKLFENDSGNKEEKRQVATVSPTVRLSFGYQGDEQTNKSSEIQPKNANQPVKLKGHTGSSENQRNKETSL